ncbi:MAG: adenosylcobinamide-GDP ribazoletransferase [Bradyrhizobium sp.]
MIKRWLGALQFLTVLPIRGSTAAPGDAAAFFPLVGALLGASAGILLLAFSPGLGRPMSAWLALAWLAAITGCVHEDGLADVADAVRAGRSREKMMQILKDSRIGAYGAIALILTIAVRWQALAQSAVNPVAGLAAALALSRASMVGLAASTPPAGTGLGQAFAAACSRNVLFMVAGKSLAIAGVAAIFTGGRPAAAMLLATASFVWLARFYFTRTLGGVNGDCLGATCQVVETVNLVILAWHPSL